MSLLSIGYFSLAANLLKSSPKILRVNKRDFFHINSLGNGQSIWERVCESGWNSAWARLPSCLSKGPLKRDFLDNCLTTFPESVISEIQKLLWSSFFSKCLKFNLYFKNAGNNWEKFLCFWYNYIWICNLKLFLLGTW